MSALQNLKTENIVKQAVSQTIQNLTLLIDEKKIWLSIEDYAKYHGTSRSSVEKAIVGGLISIQNGGLKDGTDRLKARKLIFKFFNHLVGKVQYPQLTS